MTTNASDNKKEIKSYWSIEETEASTITDESTISEELERRMENAVKSHLISDVPIGLFLSGGIDSSLIAHYAAKHSQSKITAYTASFEYDKGINETAIARKYATELGINHEEIKIGISDLPHLIEKLTPVSYTHLTLPTIYSV